MQDTIKNPLALSGTKVFTDENKLVYFLSEKREEKDVLIDFELTENASLDFTLVDFSNSDIHLKMNVELKKGARANISIASLNTNETSKIYEINTNHEESDGYSRTKMAGINAGKSILKFLGASYIKNGAHRCDTRQEGKITNLSKDSKSEVSPSLLIKENDVKASHGAALGAYNENHLFYLMSRGLTMDESKKLITFGTLLPIIEEINDEDLLLEAKDALGALTL
jgi:ABC transporter, Fe-S cluster assembly transporter permease component